jgi:hypothetical protein
MPVDMEAINGPVEQGHLPAKQPVSPPLRQQGPSRNLHARDAQLLHETPGRQRRSVRILTRLQRQHTQGLKTSMHILELAAAALEEDNLLVSE